MLAVITGRQETSKLLGGFGLGALYDLGVAAILQDPSPDASMLPPP
jgi:hypothetical protein